MRQRKAKRIVFKSSLSNQNLRSIFLFLLLLRLYYSLASKAKSTALPKIDHSPIHSAEEKDHNSEETIII